jgi:metal-dependent amidase/aminoacylase/carboxypeptidase family protein
MPVPAAIAALEAEMTAWRRHLHAIPELDFDLHQTARFVADRLRDFGVDALHTGIAKTGIVALIHGRAPGPVIGLRADMDALPITEATGLPYASRHPGSCTPAATTATPRSCSAPRPTSPAPAPSPASPR